MGAGFLAGRPPAADRAFGVLTVQSFNIGLFAIPYVSTFVGPQAIVYAAMFDIGELDRRGRHRVRRGGWRSRAARG